MGRPGEAADTANRPVKGRRQTSRQERVMATAMDATSRKAIRTGGRTTSAMAAEFADLLRLIKSLLDPYRPELHYMRGPGPKWHAKHRPAAPADAHPAPGLFHAEA